MYLNYFFDLQIRCLMSSIYGKVLFPTNKPGYWTCFQLIKTHDNPKKAGCLLFFLPGSHTLF